MKKKRTCSFTGHRILPNDFPLEELEKSVYKAINDGFNTFLCGMALGFDTVCFHLLEKIRETKKIKIVACVPCKTQSAYFNKKQKAEYERMINCADKVICLSENYYDGCMQERNKYMVDNSSRVICYLNYGHGGTYQTVKYAAESDSEVVYIGK